MDPRSIAILSIVAMTGFYGCGKANPPAAESQAESPDKASDGRETTAATSSPVPAIPLGGPGRIILEEKYPDVERHRKGVSAVDFSTSGELIATGSYDLAIQVSDAATGELRHKLTFKEAGQDSIESIEVIRFSPDGKYLAACCANEIKLWRLADWELVGTVSQRDSGGFCCIEFLPAGDCLVAQSNNHLVQVWRVPDGNLVHQFRAGYLLKKFALSPDGKVLATDNEQKNLVLFDVTSGAEVRQLITGRDYVGLLAFSPDGQTLASCGQKRLDLWNWHTGKKQREVATDSCSALAYSPDGSLLAVGWYDIALFRMNIEPPEKVASLNLRGATACGQVRFSPNSRQVVATDQSHQRRADVWTLHWSREERTLRGSEEDIRVIAGSKDGKWLASSGAENVCLWNAVEGKLVKRLELGTKAWRAHLDFSGDSKHLVCTTNSYGNGACRIWEIPSGTIKRTWNVDDGEFPKSGRYVPNRSEIFLSGGRLWDPETGQVTSANRRFVDGPLRFSRDGSLLLSVNDGIHVYRWPSGDLVRSWKPHSSGLRFGLSRDNRFVATGAWTDPEAILWDVETGNVVRRFHADDEGVSGIDISQDGSWIVTAGKDHWLKVWSLETGNLRATVPAHTEDISGLLFFGPNNRFATASSDDTIKIWDLDRLLADLPDPPHGKPDAPGVLPTHGLPKLVLDGGFAHDDLSVSSDGRWMASVVLDAAHLWDLSTGQRVWTEDSQVTNGVAISPDGRLMATAHGDDDQALKLENKIPATVRLWNIERRELIHTLTLSTSVAECVVFSPDGKTLAVAAGNMGMQEVRELSLWDVGTGNLSQRLPVKGGRVTHVVYSPDGKLLACCGFIDDVTVWDLPANRQRHRFKLTDMARSLAFSPDGKQLVACHGDYASGRVLFWDVRTGKELPQFHDFLEECWAIGFHPNGKLFVTGSMSDKKERTYKFWELPSGRLLRTLKPKRDSWRAKSVVFVPDGDSLITSGFDRLQIWDLASLMDPKFQAMVDKLSSLKAKLDFKDGLLNVDFYEGALTDADLARFPVVSQPFRLDLSGIDNLTDEGMRHLTNQPYLTELVLDSCSNVTDAGFQHIAKLPVLRSLSCNYMDHVTSGAITHLNGMTQLKSLTTNRELKEDAFTHLASLTSLEQLTIGVGRVSTTTWRRLSELRNLRHLRISGRMPDAALESIGKLARLERLEINYCVDGTGLIHLSDCQELRSLEINGENIDDEDVALLLPLKKLSRLNLNYTSVTAAGLAHVGKLIALEELLLPERVSDEGLLQLSGLVRLRSLDLERRGVSDRGLAALRDMTDLEALKLHGLPDVQGPGLINLSAAKRLVHLDLRTTGVTDGGLAHLRSLTHLRKLQLPKAITDAGLVHVSALTNLRELEMVESRVTDAGLQHLENLRQLEQLNIDETSITQEGKKSVLVGTADCISSARRSEETPLTLVDMLANYPRSDLASCE